MRTVFRRSIASALVLLLLTPIVILAQSEKARQFIDLVFSDGGSAVHLKDTVQSTARVSFTHDGKSYTVKAPVTIDVDTKIPLAESVSAVDTASKIGAYAITIIKVSESEELDDLEPSSESNKIIAVEFQVTNLADETRLIFDRDWSFLAEKFERIVAIDDLGRRFESLGILECEETELNPGTTRDCTVAFDVNESVTLTSLEFYLMDKGAVTLPEVEEEEE